MLMFLSPKMITSARDLQKIVGRFEILRMKDEFGFGGRQIRRDSTGEGGLHFNARLSN